MKKPRFKKISKEEKKTSGSIFVLIYDMAQDWMRPSPNHPLALQILIFIIKLPLLILFLLLSPIIFLVMFITFVIGL